MSYFHGDHSEWCNCFFAKLISQRKTCTDFPDWVALTSTKKFWSWAILGWIIISFITFLSLQTGQTVFTLFLCCISVFVSPIALYLHSVCGVFVLYLQCCSSFEVEEVQGKRFQDVATCRYPLQNSRLHSGCTFFFRENIFQRFRRMLPVKPPDTVSAFFYLES